MKYGYRLVVAVCVASHGLGAQGFRVNMSASVQNLNFRGLVQDSIDVTQARISANGGLETPDGYAVRCGAGPRCYYFRPGAELRAIPASLNANGTLWGLGVTGLSFHGGVRLVADLGGDRVWPGRDPAMQILEGYAEYDRGRFLARAGRQLLTSRLEGIGFDGGWLRTRWEKRAIDATVYGGWGLAQATALSPTSVTLNPLDEWRPRRRQLVAGAEIGWSSTRADVRTEYRREVDPTDDYFVSERAAISLGGTYQNLRASAGGDYNIAEGHVGSADVALTWMQPRYSITGGARRCRPYFSLWTLWGAFSPVGYNAVNASGEWRATSALTVRARGERYVYEDAAISTALVPALTDRGWRVSSGLTATIRARWTVDWSFGVDRGPGSAGDFVDGALRYSMNDRLAVALYGGSMARPLELRYYDAESKWVGARGDWRVFGSQFWIDAMVANDRRNRPDAAASSLDQVRMRAGVNVAFGSGADRAMLPPGHPAQR